MAENLFLFAAVLFASLLYTGFGLVFADFMADGSPTKAQQFIFAVGWIVLAAVMGLAAWVNISSHYLSLFIKLIRKPRGAA